MNNTKYLLVGDHRTCENFGSIATCEQLIELMSPSLFRMLTNKEK